MFLMFTCEQVGWQIDKDLATHKATFISHAIYVSSTTSEAEVAPGFGFTEEMAEKPIPSTVSNTVRPTRSKTGASTG